MAKLWTPKFRVAFPQVFAPKARNADSKPKFSIAMLFDEKKIAKDPKQKELLRKIKQAVDDALKEKFNKIPAKYRSPFKSGDDQINQKTDEVYEGFAGALVANASSNADRRPFVIDQELNPIVEPGGFYGGCYARATISVFAYDHPEGGKGVSFNILGIQKVADGDSFSGGATSTEDDFEAIATTASEDDEDLFSS